MSEERDKRTTDPSSLPPSTRESGTSEVVIPPRKEKTLPPGVEVPEWVEGLYDRYDAGLEEMREGQKDMRDHVNKAFDAVRAELHDHVKRLDAKDAEIEKRVRTDAFVRNGLPLISITLSTIAMIMWVIRFAMLIAGK